MTNVLMVTLLNQIRKTASNPVINHVLHVTLQAILLIITVFHAILAITSMKMTQLPAIKRAEMGIINQEINVRNVMIRV